MDERFSEKDSTVCLCKEITYTQIKDTIEDGADTLEKIIDRTGAGTVCGRCRKQIKMILSEEEDVLL